MAFLPHRELDRCVGQIYFPIRIVSAGPGEKDFPRAVAPENGLFDSKREFWNFSFIFYLIGLACCHISLRGYF